MASQLVCLIGSNIVAMQLHHQIKL